ncbi:MAG TPA: alpha/beta fold hydrolase [Rhodospirillales bacterium]|nr:alpha/beta fold hydrolase [Rhodospirillales bacterium]
MAEEETVIRIAASLLVAAAVLMPGRPAPAEEVKINHGGLTLNADLELAGGKTLADGVVLMTHGLLAHKGMEIMTALKGLLAERGLNTLAINLSLDLDDRHGMVDCPTPHRHRDADAMGEIAAWVVWLNNKGAGPVTLLGHSRGGNQAARYAAGNPDPAVKRLVLVAPATSNPGKPARGYYRRYKKDLAPLLKKARDLMAAGKGDALMKDVDFLYCPKTTVTAATFADYYGANPERDTPSVIRRITLPVLAVAGGSDRVNPHFGKKMKKLPQANVKLVVIEDAGHFFRDLFGEDLADAIAEFIAKGPES